MQGFLVLVSILSQAATLCSWTRVTGTSYKLRLIEEMLSPDSCPSHLTTRLVESYVFSSDSGIAASEKMVDVELAPF